MGEFFLFFEMFMKFFMELMENKEETELLSALRRKGRHELFAMTKFLRQEKGLVGWRLVKERRKVWGHYEAMEDEQLCMMVAEAVELRAEHLAGEVEPSEDARES